MVQFVNTNINTPVSTARVSKTPTGTNTEITATVYVDESRTTSSAEVAQQANKMRNDAIKEAKNNLKSQLDKLKEQVTGQAKKDYVLNMSKGKKGVAGSATQSTSMQMTVLGKTFDVSGSIKATTSTTTSSQVFYTYSYNTNNIPSVEDFAKYISDNLDSRGFGVE